MNKGNCYISELNVGFIVEEDKEEENMRRKREDALVRIG
jgi:hypothetical protein